MAVRNVEKRIERVVTYCAIGLVELLLNEVLESWRRDKTDLHNLRTAVKRLVLVVEEPKHHVALTAGGDMRHLRLLLKDRPHPRGKLGVDLGHFLELIEVDDNLLPTIRRKLGRQFEQPIKRLVNVLLDPCGGKTESCRAVLGIYGHHRNDTQGAENEKALLRIEDDACHI